MSSSTPLSEEPVIDSPAERPSARSVRQAILAIAEAQADDFVPLEGRTVVLRRLIWTNGGRYDPQTKVWSVPRHRAAEVQSIVDRVTQPAPPKQHEHTKVPRVPAGSDADVLTEYLSGGAHPEPRLAALVTKLADGPGLLRVMTATPDDFTRDWKCTPHEAERLGVVAELLRRIMQARRKERPALQTPEAVCDLVGPLMAPLEQEEMWCLPLDCRSRLIGEPLVVSRGDVDATEASPRVVFRRALTVGATSCIAVHNHPTGNPEPSPADRAVTKRLVQAGSIMGISLVDHVIIGDGGRFHSMRRANLDCFASAPVQ